MAASPARIWPALLALLLLAPACNLTQLTPSSQVIRPRVAAIEAEPAEIGLGETTTLSSLLVYPEHPGPELGQIWFACLEAGGASGCLGLDFASFVTGEEGDDDDSAAVPEEIDPRDLQFGIGEAFTYTAHGSLVEEAWLATEPEDRAEGLTVLVSVNYVHASNAELGVLLGELIAAVTTGDQETLERVGQEFADLLGGGINAARRVVISDKSAGQPDPGSCPVQELLPNQNPRLDDLTLHLEEGDAGFALGEVTFVHPGETLLLRPGLIEGSVEDYLYIDLDDVTSCREEHPYFAWLTNGGSIGSDYTFVADAEDLEEVVGRPKLNSLHLPSAEQFGDRIDLWVVVRDRRGGMTWRSWVFLPLDE
jgi:hypothetical protein